MVHVDEDDFDDFMDRVDEANKAIRDLMENRITPDKASEKERILQEKARQHEARKAQKLLEEQERKKRHAEEEHRKKWGFFGKWCPSCRKEQPGSDDNCKICECPLQTDEERKKVLLERVEVFKTDRAKKAEARDRWKRWCSTQQYDRVGAAFTDYCKWDVFEPSDDEEEELPPPPPPDTPEFKAMEKDMDERSKSRILRRAEAEKLKEEGNVFMKQKKDLKAVELYTEALSKEKSVKSIYTNRALAYIHLKRYDDAIADCSRVLDIAEFLDNNKGPGVREARIKAFMRRASARHATKEFKLAVEDIEAALALDPKAKEILQLRDVYLEDHRQSVIASKIKQSLASEQAAPDDTAAECSIDIAVETKGGEEVAAVMGEDKEAVVEAVAESDTTEVFSEEEKKELRAWSVSVQRLNDARSNLVKAALGEGESEVVQAAASEFVAATEAVELVSEETQVMFREQGGLSSCLEVLLCSKYAARTGDGPIAAAVQLVLRSAENATNMRCVVDHRNGVVVTKLLQIVGGGVAGLLPESKVTLASGQLLEALLQHDSIRRQLAGNAAVLGGILDGIVADVARASRVVDLLLGCLVNLIYHEEAKIVVRRSGCGGLGARIIDTVCPLVAHPNVDVRKRAAKVIMNMSTDTTQRSELSLRPAVAGNLVAALTAELVFSGGVVGSAQEEESFVEVLLGIMINVCLDDKLCSALLSAKILPTLTRLLNGPIPSELPPIVVSRVAALAARIAQKEEGGVAAMRELGLFGSLLHRLRPLRAKASDVDKAILDHLVRLAATAVAKDQECHQLVCANTSCLEAFVTALSLPSPATVGNAAMAISSCADNVTTLAPLGALGVVPALLEHIKTSRGPTQKNCAIALAKLAKLEKNLQQLRDLHGIELLATSLKG